MYICGRMLFDSHVHMGQYFDDYYTPPRVLRTLSLAGITHFAYSSTSAVVTDDPLLMREEREAMRELSGEKAYPFLWVTHSMLSKSGDLSLYLDDDIRGFKVHGASESWPPNGKGLTRIFELAKERELPVLLHTGGYESCCAGVYEKVCRKFESVPVILAHGRPVSEAIRVLDYCPNAFVDTAFMPHRDLCELLKRKFFDRILLGTDTPIPGRHLKSSLPRYLRARIAQTKRLAVRFGGERAWNLICAENARKLILKKFGGKGKFEI